MLLQLTKLAARNLIRNTRRTIITVVAIAVGLALMVMTINFASGSYAEMIRTGISSLAGHVVVQASGWQQEHKDTQLVADSGAIADKIAAALPDAVVARRIQLGGLLTSSRNAMGVSLQGVEPGPEAAVNNIDDKVVTGTWLDGPGGIVIGEGLARTLKVELGDRVVYQGQHGTTDVESILFRIKGIFRTGSTDVDGFVAYAPLSDVQTVLVPHDAAHQVTVHLKNPGATAAARDEVAKLVGTDGLDVLAWQQAIPEVAAMIAVDKASTDVMMLILGIIVAMGVLNTVLMSVMERIREFGVMLSIGLRPMRIALMVLIEGALLGVVGGIFGLALGALFTLPLQIWGVDYAAFMGGESLDMSGITIDALVYAVWDPPRVARYAIAAILFTVVAAAYPAWVVTRLTPVQALRSQ